MNDINKPAPNINQPISVNPPASITELESAMLAITTESGKVGYLYPGPKRALAKHVRELEAKNAELTKRLAQLNHLVLQLSQMGQSITRIWDNDTDAAYDRPNPQPFFMEAE